MNIYCGGPGFLHDARVFRRALYEIASTDKATLFPSQTFLLGDSAYSSLLWLVSSFKDNGHLTSQEKEFNFMHSSIRIVEKSIWTIKRTVSSY